MDCSVFYIMALASERVQKVYLDGLQNIYSAPRGKSVAMLKT